MGLATIDLHSHKVQTRLYKITKFGVNRDPKVSKIQTFENVKLYKEMYGHPDAVSSGWPYIIISLLVLTFLNLCISVKASLINTKLGNLVNLGVLFLTMWINCC